MTKRLVIYIIKMIGKFIFGLLFIGFQIAIIVKFIRVCLDGDFDYQQVPLLMIILVQISFRHIIYNCMSKNSFIIPGVSLRLLYRMFLPVYHVCFGRCLIAFGQKREDWNFGLMFTVCLIFPVVVKEIEFQARKIVQKMQILNWTKRQ